MQYIYGAIRYGGLPCFSAPIHPIILPKLLRRRAGLPPEYGDKVADVMKPAHMADALHLQIRLPDQQLLRPVDSEPGDIILYGVSGKPPEQPCKILRADMNLTGKAVHIRDSRGICFNSFYYRSHILAVERMLCLRMLSVNAGKMHQKFIALDR